MPILYNKIFPFFLSADNYLKKLHLLNKENKLTTDIFLYYLDFLNYKSSYYHQKDDFWNFYNLLPDDIKNEQAVIQKILFLFCDNKNIKEIISVLPRDYTYDLETVLKVIDCLPELSRYTKYSEMIYSYYMLLPAKIKYNEICFNKVIRHLRTEEKGQIYLLLFNKYKDKKEMALKIFDAFLNSSTESYPARVERNIFYAFPDEIKYDIDFIHKYFDNSKIRYILVNKQWFINLMKNTNVNKQVALDIFTSEYLKNDDDMKLNAYLLMTEDIKNDEEILTGFILNINIQFLVEKAPFLIQPFCKNEDIIVQLFNKVGGEKITSVTAMLQVYSVLPEVTRYNNDVFNRVIELLLYKHYPLIFDVLPLMPIEKFDNELIEKFREYTKKTKYKKVVDKPGRYYHRGEYVNTPGEYIGMETPIWTEWDEEIEPEEWHYEIIGYEYADDFLNKLTEAVAELRGNKAKAPDTEFA